MTDMIQEISTDYDLDHPEACGDKWEGEINQLLDSFASVATYGMNPTAHAILNAARLLEGTALESMSSQAVLFTGGTSDDSHMALESIGDAIKEKLAIWGSKLLTFFNTLSSKVSGGLTKIWESITTMGKTLVNGAWDKAKSAGRTIKAHPYKTIMAALGAASAVVAVLALVGSGAGAAANGSAWEGFIHRVKDGISKIRMPGKSITSDVVDGGKLVVNISPSDGGDLVTGNVDSLGWTKTAVNGVLGILNRIWSGLKNGVSSFGNSIKGVASKINDTGGNIPAKIGEKVGKKTGSNLLGWSAQQVVNKTMMAWFWLLTGAIYKLFSQVFSKAYAMISETFHSLKPATE